jgi:hypothetical protein
LKLFRVEGVKPASVKAIKEFGGWGKAREEAEMAREKGLT